jgi:hypothetical protein
LFTVLDVFMMDALGEGGRNDENKKSRPGTGRLFPALAIAGSTAVAGAAAAACFAALAVFASADFANAAEALLALSTLAHDALCLHHSVV